MLPRRSAGILQSAIVLTAAALISVQCRDGTGPAGGSARTPTLAVIPMGTTH